MQLINSWKQSLQIFSPKNMFLFLGQTLKAVALTYKKLLCNFWLFFLCYVIFDFASEHLSMYIPSYGFIVRGFTINIDPIVIILEAGFILMLFLVFICARSSISQVTSPHAVKYWKKFIYFIFLYIFFAYIVGDRFGLEVDEVTGVISRFSLATFDFFRIFLLIPPVFIASPLFIFLNAFILDSNGSFRLLILSIIRTLKMCLSNYPFCLLAVIGLHYLSQIWDWIIFSSLQLLQIPIVEFFDETHSILPAFRLIKYSAVFFWPIPICFLFNFYCKKLHDQIDFYSHKGR